MGYKCEQFVAKVDVNLICSICYEVLQDPHGCKDGHSFCKDCITKWLRTRQRCPLDNNKVQASNLVRNLIVHNMVQDLAAWCHPPEKDDEEAAAGVEGLEQKCGWRGKLQSLARHRETCPFQQVQCPNENCKEPIQRRELGHHDLICEYKKMECDKCRKSLVRRELQDHTADECPETLIPCPNQCTKQRQVQIQQIKRVDLDNHIKNICPKTMVICPFKDQGCPVRIERQHGFKHVQDNTAAHMFLLGKKCSSLSKENQLLKDELKNMKEEFHAQLQNTCSYTWTVHNYPNISKNYSNGSCIQCPTFWLCGYRWCIFLYPNGEHEDSTGFLSLHLEMVEDDYDELRETIPNIFKNESAIPFRLTVISQDPDTKDVFRETRQVFTKKEKNWGWPKFMKASDTLSPSYCNNTAITVKCTIQLDKPQ